MPNNILSEITGIDKSKLSDRMNRYFRNYGLGDFVSTGKNKRHIITELDSKGNKINTEIKSESHFTFYISKEMLSLMENLKIAIDILDYDKLKKDADITANLLKEISNKKSTTVHINQYINESITIETMINIEKDLLKQKGVYKKESNVILEDKDGNLTKTEIENKTNEFVPKENISKRINLENNELYEENVQEVNDTLEDEELSFDMFDNEEDIIDESLNDIPMIKKEVKKIVRKRNNKNKILESKDPEELYYALCNCTLTPECLSKEQKLIVGRAHPGCLKKDYSKILNRK